MEFRIADTFTASPGPPRRRTEQKAVKTTAFDLQMDPAGPGPAIPSLDRVADPHFWSVRVSGDIRIIVHKTERQPAARLCRPPRRRLCLGRAAPHRGHPPPAPPRSSKCASAWRSSSARPPPAPEPRVRLAPAHACSRRLSPKTCCRTACRRDWLEDVRQATEDALPRSRPAICPPRRRRRCWNTSPPAALPRPAPVAAPADPFAHPDALRRFRVVDEPRRAGTAPWTAPWEQWTVFLHPAQRGIVERSYTGPARISGSAGTGKTVVALHRAARLARRRPTARVLLTTFSPTARRTRWRASWRCCWGRTRRSCAAVTVGRSPHGRRRTAPTRVRAPRRRRLATSRCGRC